MSQEPYTALYTAPLRLALRCLDDRLLRLFVALSTYADQRGVCFPGVRELAAVTGYRVELVSELLFQLEERNMLVYLRKNERDPITHRQLPNVYMITSTLYVARDPVEGALFAPLETQLAEKPDPKLPSERIHNQNQDQESRISSKKPAAEPPPQPPTDPPNEGDAGIAAPQKQGKGKSRAGQDQKQPAQRPSEANTPPPTPSREPGDLGRYNLPLGVAEERIAEEMRTLAGNLTHANARMLVDIYGVQNARAATILYTLQPKNSIPNPAGYIRALLRRHAVSAEDVDAPAAGAPTTDPEQELTY